MFVCNWWAAFQVITILGMTDFCMHMGSFGFSNIILWGELLGECPRLWQHLCAFTLNEIYFAWSYVLLCENSFLPYVGWVTIIMTEKPIIKVCSSFLSILIDLEIKQWMPVHRRQFVPSYNSLLLSINDSTKIKQYHCSSIGLLKLGMHFWTTDIRFLLLQYLLIGALGLLVITSKE